MFYRTTIEDITRDLNTNITLGLTKPEASKRLHKHGENILPTKPPPPLILHFIEQFKSFLVVILLLATAIALILGDTIDAVAIAVIVLINATIGFVQEVKAEKTLESLKQKEVIFTLVLRDKVVEKIPMKEVVPGDILILEEGEKIPADARIIESYSLRVDESILTGESMSVPKDRYIIKKDVALADRTNMIYRDTEIVAGRGKAIVVATGKNTEIGQIAQYLGEAKKEKTPLTKELDTVAKSLTLIILGIAVIIFFLNILEDVALVDSLLVSISLAVAAIPEGLPAIVTIVLSLGVKRLAEKKSIVKKLPAVETLGAVKIIATDKTGTITQNKINLVKIILADNQEFDIEGEGFSPTGTFFNNRKKIVNPHEVPQLELLLTASVLASDASVHYDNGHMKVIGDTTEAALLVAALRAKLNIDELHQAQPRLYEVPFTSERKMMTVVNQINDTSDHFLYSKGAPEVILEKCRMALAQKKEVLAQAQLLAGQGLRSLAVARKSVDKNQVKAALEQDILKEEELEYIGLLGMQDPLRPEVKDAIANAKTAGIRTIMITGDHQQTAHTIAVSAGIIDKNERILTEDDISALSQVELTRAIKNGVNVFARISPMGKLKIIEAIKKIPHTQVAVTGDGANDAPALKASNIGIAMGISGTDITREVADIIITDDNYASIVDAIREGRTIFANLVKFIRYLISCNLSEVIVVTAGVLFGTPLPLLPIQILWVNLVTDGLPALALGVEPPEYDVMKRPPRDLGVGILHKKRWTYMMIEGTIIGISTFILFLYALSQFSYAIAQTITFTALALAQLVHAFNNRSTRKSIFQLGVFSNRFLVGAVLISVILQYLVVQSNFGNLVFKTEKLLSSEWMLIGAFAMIPLVVVELKKQLRFRILP